MSGRRYDSREMAHLTRELRPRLARQEGEPQGDPVLPQTDRRFLMWPAPTGSGSSITSGNSTWGAGTWNSWTYLGDLDPDENGDILLVGLYISNPSHVGVSHDYTFEVGYGLSGLSAPTRICGQFPYCGAAGPQPVTFPVPTIIPQGNDIFVRLRSGGSLRTVEYRLLFYRGPLQ